MNTYLETKIDNNISLLQEIKTKAEMLPDKSSSSGGTSTEDLNSVLTEQETKIAELSAILDEKLMGDFDASDATAVAGDLLKGKTAYSASGKITGTIETRTIDNLSVSGANITVTSGYYPSNITKSVTTATQATPSININSSGLITASATQTAGYVVAGTKSGTKQLTTQAAKTITPTTSSQTAVASGVYTTGAVTVAAIPNTYIKPTTTKGATTYTPTTSNQTIAAGTYCSGMQTIKGDANLKAENIKSGVSIFGVTGSLSEAEGTSGEDVTQETNAYTVKLASLETAITALETELEGKASGGGGTGALRTCLITYSVDSSVDPTRFSDRFNQLAYDPISLFYQRPDLEPDVVYTEPGGSVTFEAVCGSLIVIPYIEPMTRMLGYSPSNIFNGVNGGSLSCIVPEVDSLSISVWDDD